MVFFCYWDICKLVKPNLCWESMKGPMGEPFSTRKKILNLKKKILIFFQRKDCTMYKRPMFDCSTILYWHPLVHHPLCHNSSLGLATNARAYKGVSQEWNSGVTFHAIGSVGKCEGMNSHSPKWAFTLGVGVLMNSQIFKEWLQGLKPIGSTSSLYCWKFLKT